MYVALYLSDFPNKKKIKKFLFHALKLPKQKFSNLDFGKIITLGFICIILKKW